MLAASPLRRLFAADDGQPPPRCIALDAAAAAYEPPPAAAYGADAAELSCRHYADIGHYAPMLMLLLTDAADIFATLIDAPKSYAMAMLRPLFLATAHSSSSAFIPPSSPFFTPRRTASVATLAVPLDFSRAAAEPDAAAAPPRHFRL